MRMRVLHRRWHVGKHVNRAAGAQSFYLFMASVDAFRCTSPTAPGAAPVTRKNTIRKGDDAEFLRPPLRLLCSPGERTRRATPRASDSDPR
jgi:hypothetical protein